jgi:hypothetical protein
VRPEVSANGNVREAADDSGICSLERNLVQFAHTCAGIVQLGVVLNHNSQPFVMAFNAWSMRSSNCVAP